MKNEFLSLLDDEYLDYYNKAHTCYKTKTYLGSVFYYKKVLNKILVDTFKKQKPDKDFLKYFIEENLEFKIRDIYANLPQNLHVYNLKLVIEKDNGELSEDDAKKIAISLKYIIYEILVFKVEEKEKSKRYKAFKKELQK